MRPEVRRLAGYVPGEQPRDRRTIKLNTNENPYPPSPRVLEAIRAAATADLRLYPDPFATELRARAGEVYGFSPEFVLAGNGSDELLAIVLRSCAGPGDRVVYPTPTYTLYDTLVAIQGATTIAVPFPDDFRLPVELLGEQGQVLTIVCNPNAPSGTLAPIVAIEELASSVRGLVVVDEAYVDFASDSALPLVHRYDNVLVLRTFSKSFSLCGMRIGLAFGHPDLLAELAKVKDSYNVGRLGLAAAAAALDDRAYMEANSELVRSTRSVLAGALRELGFRVLPSETNFILARRPGENLAPLQEALKQKGVLVRYFDIPELRDALRITVGTPDEVRALIAALRS
ncbi:MAG TPA: histidinol-phosphate transaminase [Polyangiaceae bacterium]|nr:histidinol-phosphate transaminase [Polyangiaceae bacterium]